MRIVQPPRPKAGRCYGVRMRWCAVLVAVLLAGCGVLHPAPPPPPAPPPVQPLPLRAPPPLSANGVDGSPLSWCGKGGCVDGALDPSKPLQYPDVGTPLTFQPDQPVLRIVVNLQAPNGSPVLLPVEGTDGDGTPIGDVLAVSELPPGAWTVLVASVYFAAGGSASYVWELAKPESSP
jgi:hypothetical protein